MLRWGVIACCILALAVPAAAEGRPVHIDAQARAVSFTVHGPALLRLGPHVTRLAAGPTRVELGRRAGTWHAAAGRGAVLTLARPRVRLAGGRVTDRLAGAGPVALLGSRLLARSVHPGWLPGPLARRGAWMRGMAAAGLWRMGELDDRHRGRWWRRAARATLRLRGGEHEDTHDVGFVYGEGAAYGYDRACRASRRRVIGRAACDALHASATAAADRLAAMVRESAPARVLPTHLARCPDCPPGARESIIDSMMNVGLLPWAERNAGRSGYARLALLHARALGAALIRPDGCTAQAVFVASGAGRLFGVHTHQGLAAGSTWARGQAWALLGFARLAQATGDRWARRVSRAVAGCWLAKTTPGRLVRFDLDSSSGPFDSSAQAVAAAGLATLARVDRARAARWRRAARAQLSIVERLISALPPLGRLGRQTYVAGGDPADDDVELPIGQLYVLDAHARLP